MLDPATRKYLDEFQSAQSMAAIGAANTVRQKLITITICPENLGCIVTHLQAKPHPNVLIGLR